MVKREPLSNMHRIVDLYLNEDPLILGVASCVVPNSEGPVLGTRCRYPENDDNCDLCRDNPASTCRQTVTLRWWANQQTLPVSIQGDELREHHRRLINASMAAAEVQGWYGYLPGIGRGIGLERLFKLMRDPIYVWESNGRRYAGDKAHYLADMGQEPSDEEIGFYWWKYLMRVCRPATNDEVREGTWEVL